MTAALTAREPVARPRATLGWLLLITVLVAVFDIQPGFWCACGIGTISAKFAVFIEACVLIRALIGLLRRDASLVWLFYMPVIVSLPWVIPLVVTYHVRHP